ncbi:trk system potassium uptake protein TrkH [Litorimonas taeanensis]|uniref:Trk system potassium uptake protein n=1 Tax=Litorimonas taeanensis TaxID=568099 RepID=A0A420WFP2_9PROT|nr:TrkH family potassium uptake protein [Litorimonas taeanensis]RKQ69786.1 trk system potassium uptake protein TrkH [Litorimonas taeanensis]
MLDLRPVFFVVGLMVAALGLIMFIPMFVDMYHDGLSWRGFGISGILSFLFGVSMALANYTPKPDLGARGAFLLTVSSWVALSAFASLPFLMEPIGLSITDAIFEATSGITTTGSTILTGLDHMPRGVLLWRAMLQWIGGIGIIVTAMAILPMLKIGGMQLFRLESSDMGEKILPRAASIAMAISLIYLGLTILCTVLYMVVGMSGFDAIAHAMTTLATGGYSTSDASMGGFMDQGADLVCIAFMMAGGMPFGMYLLMTRGDFKAPLRDPQVRAFVGIMISLIALVTLGLWAGSEYSAAEGASFWQALRLSAFNTVSIVTGTGYATTDYNSWGPFALGAFFVFMFIGGCAGSTACSIKIFRYQVAFEALRAYLFKMPRNHAVSPLRYGGAPLPESVVFSILSYFFLFFLTFAVTAIALSFIGLDPITAWSGAGSAVANVGPGLGEIIGPAGTYQSLPASAKWVLMTAMIVGRLEIITALVILNPAFWRT